MATRRKRSKNVLKGFVDEAIRLADRSNGGVHNPADPDAMARRLSPSSSSTDDGWTIPMSMQRSFYRGGGFPI